VSWQIALGLFYLTVIGQALLQRSYSQRSQLPESFPPVLSYLIGVTPLGIIVGLFLSHHVQWSWWLGFLLLIEGTFIGLYNWLSFRAIKRLPLARFQTIYQSYEVVVIILGWILLRETLTGYQVTGAILLLGAALLAIRAPRKQLRQLRAPIDVYAVTVAVFAAVAMGIGLVAEKAALGHMDIGAYFIFGYLTQTIALLVLAGRDATPSSLKAVRSYDLIRSGSMGILSALMGFFYIVAIVKSNNISLITALSAFTLPLIVLAGLVFLRERENLKLLGAAVFLGFIGLLVTAL